MPVSKQWENRVILFLFTIYIYLCCCCCSVAKLWLTFCDTLDCSTSGSSVIHCLPSLLKFMSIESVMLSNHLILCCPLLLLPSIFPGIRSFPMSQLLTSDGQSPGASASASAEGWLRGNERKIRELAELGRGHLQTKMLFWHPGKERGGGKVGWGSLRWDLFFYLLLIIDFIYLFSCTKS